MENPMFWPGFAFVCVAAALGLLVGLGWLRVYLTEPGEDVC